MAKLPQNLRVRMARKMKSLVWKIDELLFVVKTEVEARELSKCVEVSEEKNPRLPKVPYTAKALYMKDGQKIKIQCIYCDKMHFSASCEDVTNANKRKKLFIKSNRCFKCLRIGHQVKHCKNHKNCRICSASKRNEQETKNSPNTKEDKERPNTKTPAEKTTMATSSTKTRGTVLLQTATAIATNEENTKSTKVRILFHSGSQRSYITDSLQSPIR